MHRIRWFVQSVVLDGSRMNEKNGCQDRIIRLFSFDSSCALSTYRCKSIFTPFSARKLRVYWAWKSCTREGALEFSQSCPLYFVFYWFLFWFLSSSMVKVLAVAVVAVVAVEVATEVSVAFPFIPYLTSLPVPLIAGGTRSGSGCRGPQCRRAGIIAGSVVGGVVGLTLIILLIVYCCYRRRNRRSASNLPPINRQDPRHSLDRSDSTNKNVSFRSGVWSSRYYQYGRWQGPHRMSLQFDPASGQVTGHGRDNVGDFTIDGTFFNEASQLILNKFYELGTGVSKENFGHTAALQLTWNAAHRQFEGKWSVQHGRYRGEDRYELKFEDPSGALLQDSLE